MKYVLILAIVALSFQINAQPKCVTGDCINGVGKLVTKEYTYQGTFLNSKILKGKITFSDGSTLEGKFVDGKLEGYDCVQIESDGTTITGQFIAGEIVSGRIEDKLGNVQEGDFKNGNLNGKNCFVKFADGSTFRGELNEGKRVKGKLTFAVSDPEHSYYDGEFSYKEDIPYFNGKGWLYLRNGNDPIGPNWVYNDPIGNGEPRADIPQGKLAIALKEQNGIFLIKGDFTRDEYDQTQNFIFDTGASLVSVPFSVLKTLYTQKIVTDADFKNKISLKNASGDVVSGMTFNIKELKFKTTDGEWIKLYNVEAVVKTDKIILEALNLASEPPILLGQSALSKLKKFELDYEQKLLLISNP